MQEPILLQAEGDSYEPGCAYSLYAVMTFFGGCLAVALWFAGYRGNDLLWTGINVLAVPMLIGGLIHFATYLMRTRFRLTVMPAGFIYEVFRRGGARSITEIPINNVRKVHIHGKSIVLETVQGRIDLKNLRTADPDVFWLKLQDIVNRYGKDGIEDRNWHRKNNAIPGASHPQVDSLPALNVPQIPVTYHNGAPILPQSLTDEQAEGVFRPFQADTEPQFDLGEKEPDYEQHGDL